MAGSKIPRSSLVIHLKVGHAQLNRKSAISGLQIGSFQGRSFHDRWSRRTKTLGPTTTPPCPKNCSDCKDGDCLVCDSGFALVSLRRNKTICITCASRRNGKKVDRSQCVPEPCGKGCLNCTESVCSECKDGFEMLPNKNKCKKKKDCGRGCLRCLLGVCSKCKDGLSLNQSSKRCVKPCTAADPDSKTPACKGKGKGKEGKNKRKGGKGKPKRRPTPYPKS